MGKKNRKKTDTANQPLPAEKATVIQAGQSPSYSFNSFRFQAILLTIIGLVCFANSFKNLYALDDQVVILKNEYVQEGFAGLPKIFSSDAIASFYEQYNSEQQLSGGRYRPLSIATFAIEQQLFDTVRTDNTVKLINQSETKPPGTLAYIRHVVNVISYILSVLALLYFLRNFIFKEQPLIAFLTSLLFIIHPIHTEVVANIKSLDEIFSFLFFMLTFIFAFRYHETEKKKDLWLAMAFYFLAFLSKEYAITLLVLLPMLFYIVKKDTLAKSVTRAFPYLLVAVVFLLIRTSVIGITNTAESSDIQNNPFFFATDIEKLATKIQILLHYLSLMFYPNVLSCDYSYNTIPYVDFSNGWVWLSLFIYTGMVVAMIILFRKRNIISFALAFYLLHLFLVSNLVFDLGATMGERLAYHSSLGFVMIIAIGINFLLQKINQPILQKITLVALCSVLVFWSAAKDIKRNKEWMSADTVALADVKKYPNSMVLNSNSAMALINLASLQSDSVKKIKILDSAVANLKKAVTIYPLLVNAYLNMGVAYAQEGNLDKAKESWDSVKVISPNDPILPQHYEYLGITYYNKAFLSEKTDPKMAVYLFEKATECDPNNAGYLNAVAIGYYYVTKEPEKARQAWEKSLRLVPNNQPALIGMALFNKK